jgi:hypothetical protein
VSLVLATLGMLQATHMKHAFANNALNAMAALHQQATAPSFGALPLGVSAIGYAQSHQPVGLPRSSANLEAKIQTNWMMAQAAGLMQESIANNFKRDQERQRANIASGLSLWA